MRINPIVYIRTSITKFFSGNSRSIKIKKQVIYSFSIKGLSILLGLLYVPLLLDYLDSERYGIWLTLSSIIVWFNFFDAGLGNGLRNKFTEALAKSEFELGTEYVSTSYVLLSFIFIPLLIIFHIVNPLMDWNQILNTETINQEELSKLVSIVFTFFILRFLLKLIGVILIADQRPAVNNAFGPLSNLIAFIVIYILMYTIEGSLVSLGLVLSLSPFFVYLVASVYFFSKDYRDYRPRLKYVKLIHYKDLLGIGIKLFIIQVASLILLSSANLLIIQYFNSQEVTVYNIAYKYFQVPIMLLMITGQPLWSATTDAYHQNELNWIKNALKKYIFLSLASVLIIVLFVIANKFVFSIWIKDRLLIPQVTVVTMAVYAILYVLSSPFSYIINGIGKLYITVSYTIFSIIFFFPLSIMLMKTSLQSAGVIAASAIIALFRLALQSVQVKKILNKKAFGIWNK